MWIDATDAHPYFNGTIVFRQLSDFGGGLTIEVIPSYGHCIVEVEMIPHAFTRLWRPNEQDALGIIDSLKQELELISKIKNASQNEAAYLKELRSWIKSISEKYNTGIPPKKWTSNAQS